MQSLTEKFRHSYSKISKIQESNYLCTFLLKELRLLIFYLSEGDPPISLWGVPNAPTQALCWSSCREFVDFQIRYKEDFFFY